MEPQKSIILPIVSAVLVSGVIFGGLGYYLANNNITRTTPASPTPVSSITTSPTTAPSVAVTITNIFDVTKAKVGDKVGDLTIKSIEPYIKGQADINGVNASNGNLSSRNAKVTFSGSTTLTGNFEYVNHEAGIGGSNEMCITSLDSASLKTFPLGIGDNNAYFCFTNIELAKSQLTSTVGAKGTATITINNYVYNVYPSEVTSSAVLVSVTSKK